MRSPALVPLLLLSLASALPAAENPPPRRARPAPILSPEVAADRQVTFRLSAPNADEVLLSGQWASQRSGMSKDANGVWSVTVGPVPPGVWEYSFVVDGLAMIDPGNPAIKPMRQPRTSILHLPGDPPLVFDFQEVPHGTVRFHTYASKALRRLRELAVYTPPGYDAARNERYPTLYLQHGSGDNHATWVVHGKAHWILDNLLAQGRVVPMVMVMMDGHAAVPGGGGDGRQDNTTLFERDLLEDVLPLVESNYRVRRSPRQRAIAGLSMGGGQSLTVGLRQLERFGWVAGFSASAPSDAAIASALEAPHHVNRRLRLLWIACGREDFLLQRNEAFIATLQAKGIEHEWHLTDGNHSWPIWRGYLADLAPRLFR